MKVGIYIDGGYLRALTKQAGIAYTPDHIEAVAHACVCSKEVLFRVLYYDCEPYQGIVTLPVSQKKVEWKPKTAWIRRLARKPLFAVRLGTLQLRGFILRNHDDPKGALRDEDFKPDFLQKGVDMRLGIDIVRNASQNTFERIILISGDTDCIPAMRHARTDGTQVVIVKLPGTKLASVLEEHSDFVRQVSWPNAPACKVRTAQGRQGRNGDSGSNRP